MQRIQYSDPNRHNRANPRYNPRTNPANRRIASLLVSDYKGGNSANAGALGRALSGLGRQYGHNRVWGHRGLGGAAEDLVRGSDPRAIGHSLAQWRHPVGNLKAARHYHGTVAGVVAGGPNPMSRLIGRNLIAKDKGYYNFMGKERPLEGLNNPNVSWEDKVHNIYDEYGNRQGSLTYTLYKDHATGKPQYHYADEAFLRPEFRNFQNLQRLVQPLTESNLPVQTYILNAKLAKLLAMLQKRGKMRQFLNEGPAGEPYDANLYGKHAYHYDFPQLRQ